MTGVQTCALPISIAADQPKGKNTVSQISFDDGVSWNLIKAPIYDSHRIKYDCQDTCYLHLHAFTERRDPRDLYGSLGAPGFMIGVGNVGPTLVEFAKGDTYMSSDGGRSWFEIAKDAHIHEFGDYGGIILLANSEEPVDYIKYSSNGGNTFQDLKICDEKITISNIISEPSGTTLQFVVVGQEKEATVFVSLDFTHLFLRSCDTNMEDFETWGPLESSCYFGELVTVF